MLFAIAAVWSLPVLFPQLEHASVELTLRSLTLLRLAIAGVLRFDDVIAFDGTSIRIASECTSLQSTLLFVGAVLAYPAPWRAKLLAGVLGTAALWLCNILRICALVAVLRWAPQVFDPVHVYLWQSVTPLTVMGLFVLWARRVARARPLASVEAT